MGQQFIGSYLTQGAFDTLSGDPFITQTDVGGNGTGEEVRVLKHDAHMTAQPLLRQILDLLPVNRYASLLRIIEAEQQVDDGAFAGAGMAHKGDSLARACLERDIAQDEVLL